MIVEVEFSSKIGGLLGPLQFQRTLVYSFLNFVRFRSILVPI